MAAPDSETLHERYDRDERRFLDAAATDLWASPLLDEVIDLASPIMRKSEWKGLPDDAPPRTSERRTAVAALHAMALRASRAVALNVRAGYAPEALAGLRRLAEAAGHAQRVAEDQTGQYAENWMRGKGRAAKPRVAFGPPENETMWKFMSGHAHAVFEAYARHSATFDGRRLVHYISPSRDAFWDDIALWLAARHLIRAMAAVLKVHPEIDQEDFLLVAGRVVEAESRIEATLVEHRKLPENQDPGPPDDGLASPHDRS